MNIEHEIDFSGCTGNATTATATTAFSMDDCMAAMRKAWELRNRWVSNRNALFLFYRGQGHTIYALDRGMGEEWVVDDELYFGLKAACEPAPEGMQVGSISGVRLYRLTDAPLSWPGGADRNAASPAFGN